MGIETILVTGASGLLGANLVREFGLHGRSVVAQYLNSPAFSSEIPRVRCDLTDPTATRQLVEDIRPQWIVHCAAATSVDWCEQNQSVCNQVNAGGALVVAKAARSSGAGLVYISTDSVFDGELGGYAETDATKPVNAYGRSKLQGEQLVEEVLPSALIVRMNIFGFHPQGKPTLAEWILDRLNSGRDVPGFADVTFSPLLVNAVASLLLDLMTAGGKGHYHLGSSDHCSKYEFALRLAGAFGFDERRVRVESASNAQWIARRPKHTWLRTERASLFIGRAMPSIQDGINCLKRLADEGFPAELRAACT